MNVPTGSWNTSDDVMLNGAKIGTMKTGYQYMSLVSDDVTYTVSDTDISNGEVILRLSSKSYNDFSTRPVLSVQSEGPDPEPVTTTREVKVTEVVEEFTLPENNSWLKTITEPLYDENGRTYSYYFVETSNTGGAVVEYVNSSGTAVSNPSDLKVDDDSTQTIVNNYETVNKTATKTWSDTAMHPTIYFKLFYEVNNGVGDDGFPDVEDVEVAGAEAKELPNGTSTVTWNNLPKYDTNGDECNYLVKEYIMDGGSLVPAAPEGYVKTENGLTVTNTKSETYDPRTTYTGTKTWVDTANNGATRPDSLHVSLYANGVAQSNVALWTKGEGTNANVWTYTFSDLPVFDQNGNYIQYTVTETPVDGYTAGTPDATSTRYQILTAQDDPNSVERVTTCSSLDITLDEETDLAYVAIKKNAHSHLIWTQRAVTNAEKQRLYTDINKISGFIGEMSDSTVEFISGLPISTAFEKGKVTVTKTSAKEMHVAFERQNQWAQLCYGSYKYEYAPGTTAFTYTLKTVSVNATKAWVNTSDVSMTPAAGTTVTFDVYIGETALNKPVVLNGKTDVANEAAISTDPAVAQTQEVNADALAAKAYESEPWKAVWMDLPERDASGNLIQYTVKETVCPNGFENQTTEGVSSGETITNKQTTIDISFVKTDGSGNGLEGAKFQLWVDKGTTTANYVVVKSSTAYAAGYEGIRFNDGKGGGDIELTTVYANEKTPGTGVPYESGFVTSDQTMTLKNLPDGKYKLIEVDAPDGYVILANEIYIEVANGVVTSTTASNASTSDKVHLNTTGATAVLTVDNTPGIELPSSGGPGTRVIYLTGALLTLLGVVMLMGRKIRA